MSTTRRWLGPAALAVAGAGLLGGCNSLLDVEAPSRVLASTVYQPGNAGLLVTSTVADFECSFGSYVEATGLMSDELADAALIIVRWEYDRREVSTASAIGTNPCTSLGLYTPLSTARFQADELLKHLEQWTDAEVANRATLTATAAAYAGYSYLLMGEAMCSAAYDLGPELQRPAIFALAEDRFTRAINAAQPANASDILSLARVGRARTRLNLGKKTEAGTDAQLVPVGYVKNATFAATTFRRNNFVAIDNVIGNLVTVDPAFRNLTFGGVADPRVNVINANRTGSDGSTPMWVQQKFLTQGSPIQLATWEEAQLILAEAQGGQPAVDIINALHMRVGLPSFASSVPTAIQAQIIDERRRELFLESQRFYDIARYNVALVPAPGTPYPPKAGGVYGNQTCLPLPDVERRNNPNVSD